MASEAQIAANRRNAQLVKNSPRSIEESTAYAKAFKLYCAKLVEEHKAPLVQAMLKRAIEGDIEAFKALLDRAHGKPAQAVEVGGVDGQPIVFMPLELIKKHSLDIIEAEETRPQELPQVNSTP